MTAVTYSPGSLVRARGREWIVLTGSDAETLRVRPVSGSEEDQTLIHMALEAEPVAEATFPRPDPRQKAGHDAALLLRDALLLSLRRGAGPFRGFGQIAVEPRAYQLVPLLMALKLDPVRLLIADDVGVGKTIEAALIARELLDRGRHRALRGALCPPHLVEQWVSELEARFHIRRRRRYRGERAPPRAEPPAQREHLHVAPHTVVSLDYIKSERSARRVPARVPGVRHRRRGAHLRVDRAGSPPALRAPEGALSEIRDAAPRAAHRDAAQRGRRCVLPAPRLARPATSLKLTDASGDERDERLRERLAAPLRPASAARHRRVEGGQSLPAARDQGADLRSSPARGSGSSTPSSTTARAVVESAVGRRSAASGSTSGARWRSCVAWHRARSGSGPGVAHARRASRRTTSTRTRHRELRVFDGSTADALPDDDVEPPAATERPRARGAHRRRPSDLAGQPAIRSSSTLTDHVARARGRTGSTPSSSAATSRPRTTSGANSKGSSRT
jgi:hypothetical protein